MLSPVPTQEGRNRVIDIFAAIFGAIALIGAAGAAIERDPFAKLIAVGVIAGGVVPFIADRGYLDVAIAVALVVPVTTIFILLVCRREEA
ncbi:MAG: EhaD family protein [Methanomicrobiaceae archaeon]|nr:EhaD family protein [Methanomicrobiaceae archaeon]